MTTQTIVDGVTLSAASWANDVDNAAYAHFTGVAGTNTLTATGPANFSYTAGAYGRFIPVTTNTVSTTLNVTPSGGAALGAKDVFLNGAALTGGEIVTGEPQSVVYDGTRFHLLGHAPRMKVVVFSRDTSSSSGTQAVTGVGFKPKTVVFLSGFGGGSARASIGMDDSAAPTVLFNNHNAVADTWGIEQGFSIEPVESGTAFNKAKITSLDADGFTLTWTKTGLPSGVVSTAALCLR